MLLYVLRWRSSSRDGTRCNGLLCTSKAHTYISYAHWNSHTTTITSYTTCKYVLHLLLLLSASFQGPRAWRGGYLSIYTLLVIIMVHLGTKYGVGILYMFARFAALQTAKSLFMRLSSRYHNGVPVARSRIWKQRKRCQLHRRRWPSVTTHPYVTRPDI